MNKIQQLQKIIDESQRIVFFTGAGVSVDSGIPDFRSQDGLYHLNYDVSPETILSHSYFEKHPEEFYRFYRDKMIYPEVKPNITHDFIAKIEKKGKSLGVITQNIDGLHQAAGSKRVVELHGSVLRNTCMRCHKHYDLNKIINTVSIPRCTCGGIIKPDVVLYEEALDETSLDTALSWIQRADCLMIFGTSLSVYPAAGLVRYFHGKHLVVINKSSTYIDQNADLCFNEGLSNVLSQIRL